MEVEHRVAGRIRRDRDEDVGNPGESLRRQLAVAVEPPAIAIAAAVGAGDCPFRPEPTQQGARGVAEPEDTAGAYCPSRATLRPARGGGRFERRRLFERRHDRLLAVQGQRPT